MGTVIELLFYVFVAISLFFLWKLGVALYHTRSRDILIDVDAEAGELQSLAADKARILADIKELEFDYDVGHLSKADYDQLRSRLEHRAIGIMKRLDTLRGDVDYDALIDDELDRRLGDLEGTGAPSEPSRKAAPRASATPQKKKKKKKKAPSSAAKSKTKPTTLDTPRAEPVVAEAATAQACQGCGADLAADDRFCSKCGTPTFVACDDCGHENDPDANFCSRCGKSFGRDDESAKVVPLAVKEASS